MVHCCAFTLLQCLAPLVAQDPDVTEETLALFGQTTDHRRVHTGFGFVEAYCHMIVGDEDRVAGMFGVGPRRPGVAHSDEPYGARPPSTFCADRPPSYDTRGA